MCQMGCIGLGMTSVRSFGKVDYFPLYNDRAKHCQCRLSAVLKWLDGFKKGGLGWRVASHRQGHRAVFLMTRLITNTVHSSPRLAPSASVQMVSTCPSTSSGSGSCPMGRDRSIVTPQADRVPLRRVLRSKNPPPIPACSRVPSLCWQ